MLRSLPAFKDFRGRFNAFFETTIKKAKTPSTNIFTYAGLRDSMESLGNEDICRIADFTTNCYLPLMQVNRRLNGVIRSHVLEHIVVPVTALRPGFMAKQVEYHYKKQDVVVIKPSSITVCGGNTNTKHSFSFRALYNLTAAHQLLAFESSMYAHLDTLVCYDYLSVRILPPTLRKLKAAGIGHWHEMHMYLPKLEWLMMGMRVPAHTELETLAAEAEILPMPQSRLTIVGMDAITADSKATLVEVPSPHFPTTLKELAMQHDQRHTTLFYDQVFLGDLVSLKKLWLIDTRYIAVLGDAPKLTSLHQSGYGELERWWTMTQLHELQLQQCDMPNVRMPHVTKLTVLSDYPAEESIAETSISAAFPRLKSLRVYARSWFCEGLSFPCPFPETLVEFVANSNIRLPKVPFLPHNIQRLVLPSEYMSSLPTLIKPSPSNTLSTASYQPSSLERVEFLLQCNTCSCDRQLSKEEAFPSLEFQVVQWLSDTHVHLHEYRERYQSIVLQKRETYLQGTVVAWFHPHRQERPAMHHRKSDADDSETENVGSSYIPELRWACSRNPLNVIPMKPQFVASLLTRPADKRRTDNNDD